jgi:MFS family permease
LSDGAAPGRSTGPWTDCALRRLAAWLHLRPDDLLRDRVYRRLWLSVLCSSFGGQITLLALPLTAAVLLKASPAQMGLLTAVEIVPFALFSLPGGVWLDRVRKLPVYIAGELAIAVAVVSVPVAAWAGWLNMTWLYVVGFMLGTVSTLAGSAAQIVLTQVVPRERLVEAHARNGLATSGAEVVGPGLAGALIRLLGAPLTLLVDALMVLASAAILRGVRVHEDRTPLREHHFRRDLAEGLRFVLNQRLLVALALTVGTWQMCHNAAIVVQILFATRTLGLSEQAVGLCYMGVGVGSVLVGIYGDRISQRIGPGPSLLAGYAVCALGWLTLSFAPVGPAGVLVFASTLVLYSAGGMLIFINFIALRQAVTPEPLLGRMTTTVRWLILLPAGPGALLGGWLGEHHGLRASLWFAGGTALLAVLLASWHPLIRSVRALPEAEPMP